MYRNIATTRGLTRQDVEDPDKVKQLIEHDLGFLIGVPSTVQYWHKRKSELFAIIRQLGKLRVFLMLSAYQVHWPYLLKLLAKLQLRLQELGVDEGEMIQSYAATLVNSDLGSCENSLNTSLGLFWKCCETPGLACFSRTTWWNAHLFLWLNQALDEEVSNDFMPNTVRTTENLRSVDHDAL
ncbi:hypothetical protein HPB48_013685 [Haemaphysalis longicornis]|uniref:Uncharacterized protein n=1 Tax=Haemaphysalis longicornis TaxID=44386 RepID=A0A9J6FX05_HAELO|nr:hypothetical protein HPB48_013685 [Haemaphysalis longicornis]